MSDFDMKSELAHIRRYLGILGDGLRNEKQEASETELNSKKG